MSIEGSAVSQRLIKSFYFWRSGIFVCFRQCIQYLEEFLVYSTIGIQLKKTEINGRVSFISGSWYAMLDRGAGVVGCVPPVNTASEGASEHQMEKQGGSKLKVWGPG